MKAYHGIKKLLDLLFSAILTVLLSPLLILLAVLIKIDSPGPVLFKQKRIGENKTEFWIYKYRTMRMDTPKDTPTHLLSDTTRYITRIGKLLRKSSLDELPQLLNILQGNMSFIGPRPALWNQQDLIEARDAQISKYDISANSIKPGLTGWAQVNGRDELSIPVKAEYDGYYAARYNFMLDMKILFMTVFNVISATGVSEGVDTSSSQPDKTQEKKD